MYNIYYMNPKKESAQMALAIFIVTIVFFALMYYMFSIGIIDREKFIGFSSMGLVLTLIFGGVTVHNVWKSKPGEAESSGKSYLINRNGGLIVLSLFVFLKFSNYYFNDPLGPNLIAGYLAIFLFVFIAWKSAK